MSSFRHLNTPWLRLRLFILIMIMMQATNATHNVAYREDDTK